MNAARGLESHPTKGRRLLVDANLLVLYCVGLLDPAEICKHPTSKAFTEVDFLALCSLLDQAKDVTTTQPVLTETSNLLGRKEHLRRDLRAVLSVVFRNYSERNSETSAIMDHPAFMEIGLTDCGLWECAREGSLTVLTADRRLAGMLEHGGLEAVNFNHLRHHWM